MNKPQAKVNVFLDGDVWCAAIWIAGEFDCSDPVTGLTGKESEDEVISHVRTQMQNRYDVTVHRAEEIDTTAVLAAE